MSLTLTLFAKTNFLPSLSHESFATKEVYSFLEEQSKNKISITKSQTSRDILGRIKNQKNTASHEEVLVYDQNKFLDVYISPIEDIPSIQTINGRYEINSAGVKSYWFNDEKLSEKDYFNKVTNITTSFRPETIYRAKLSRNDIEILLKGATPVFIDTYKEPILDYYTNYNIIFSYSDIFSHAHNNGFKGQEIGIFFDEIGCPDPIGYNRSYFIQLNNCNNGIQMHPTGVASILSKTAPMATLYAHDGSGISSLEDLKIDDHTPKIELSSHSWHYKTNGSYSIYDKVFDNYIYKSRLISFVASGNIDPKDTSAFVGSPALALNTIAVGAVNPSNNNYASYSKWKNSNVGNQKPEMANYSEFYFPNINLNIWDGNFAGTSASTPYTAATYANLLSQHAFLKRHPELIKALVVSSEKIPIGNPNHDEDNNWIAAEGLPKYSSLAWNHRFRYWNGENTCCLDQNNKIVFTEANISSNTHYRIAIAWLTSGDYAMQHQSISQDFDLLVWQGNRLIASSSSARNPFEIVDFTTNSNNNLKIEIIRYANSGDDNIILGYSLWNDF